MTDQHQHKLMEIKERVQQLIQNGYLNEAETILIEFSKLIPNDPDKYTLKAMLSLAKGEYKEAIVILTNAINYHPLNFDLLVNLGTVFEQTEEYLEAYHLYMKASYLSKESNERDLITENLKRISPHFIGSTRLDVKDKFMITTSLTYGEKSLIVKTDLDRSKERLLLLHNISKHLSREAETVLEIEFGSGIISKNLNYYGYDVEAVDSRKAALVEIIAKEWQENLRQPEQRKARYFHNDLQIDDIEHLSTYDIIIIAPNHIEFYQDESRQFQLTAALLGKANQQLFVKLPKGNNSNKACLNQLFKKGVTINCILEDSDLDGPYELFLIERENSVEDRFVIPNAISAISSCSTIVEVDVSKCCDKYSFSYDNNGFHPFVEMLKQYKKNPRIKYDNSILKQYYNILKPKNLGEILYHSEEFVPPFLKKGWVGYPWLWNETLRVIVEETPGQTRPGGNHFFGPNTMDFGLSEMQRLTSSCDLLEKIGYLPELFADGYITGYMLKYKQDYRFVITEGQHRMAALAALGYKKITCRFSQDGEYPRIVDYKDIKKWPQVKNGTYTRKLAEKVFLRFFELNGRERAQQCGLIDKRIN